MTLTVAQLQTKISVDDASANKSLDDVGDKVGKTGGLFGTLAATALGVFAGGALSSGFGFLVGQIGDTITIAKQYQQVQAQLVQGIKSTGDASGETVPALEDLADKYSKLTTFSAAAIEQSEAVTLTFTNIGQNVFPQATMAAEDLATRMGEDLPSATLQLDKALGNPIQGITALTRVGVVFTEQQKEQIKAMAASGNMAGAQAIILKELQKEFGGSAEAAGKTLPGALAIMGNELEDTKEKIGAGLIPVLAGLLGALLPVIGGVGSLISAVLPAVSEFISDMGALAEDIGSTIGAMLGLGGAFKGVQDPAKTLGAIGKQLADALNTVDYWANTAWAGFARGVGPLGDLHTSFLQLRSFISGQVQPVMQQLTTFFTAQLLPTFGQVANFVMKQAIPAYLQFEGAIASAVIPILQTLWGVFQKNILPVLGTLWNVIKTDVMPALAQIWGEIAAKLLPALQNLWAQLSPILIPVLKAAGAILQGVLGPALQGVGWLLGNVVGPALIGVIDLLSGLINAVSWAIGKLGALGSAVQNFQNSGVGQILGHIPGFASGGTLPQGWALVGEQGPELIRAPGAQVYPMPSGLPSGGGGGAGGAGAGGGAPIVVNITTTLDGRVVAQNTVKHMPGVIRQATGGRAF